VSKLNDVETVETVEGAEATQNNYEERKALDSWTTLSGVESLEGSQSFYVFAVKILGSHSFQDAKISRSLFGISESKKSAEWWNVINDKNREWTDGPKHQES
jgi:hypothetical protein